MKVGYIGLGAMGSALARRLLRDHALSVWDINSAAVAAFEKLGASVAPSAAELARRCDVVLLCLPRSADVHQVIFGTGGLAEGLTPGKIVIDQTSGIPEETRHIARQLAQHGVAMLDAPVAGGVPAAEAGTITIMVSGATETYQAASPVLHTISSTVIRCGERLGDGQAIKLVNNVINASVRLATLEVVAMGRKAGLSLATLSEVINMSTACSRISQNVLPALLEGRAATNFALPLMVKDVDQAIALGIDAGAPMPIASLTRGLLQIGVNTLGKDARLEDVVGLIESMAGTRLVDAPGYGPAPAPAISADGKNELVVGYVGLGAMGAALVRRLMRSRQVHVYDVRPEVMRELEAEGAVAAQDLPALARACDVIMICVPTSAVVREILFGAGGLAEGLAPGKIVVDQTTGDPAETLEIAADLQRLGVALVDAPVSGGPGGAAAGTVATICGGPAEVFVTVRPVLESISPNIVYCGETGTGHIAKLVKNALGACNRIITYEAVAMGVKNGLKLEDIAKVVNQSSGWSRTFERILAVLASGGETAKLRIELMVKDLTLASQLGARCGAPMLIANEVRNTFEAGANALGGDANIDEMARMFETGAGIKFTGA
jgi:3-hydroxyisobutyrate dehydrogenase